MQSDSILDLLDKSKNSSVIEHVYLSLVYYYYLLNINRAYQLFHLTKNPIILADAGLMLEAYLPRLSDLSTVINRTKIMVVEVYQVMQAVERDILSIEIDLYPNSTIYHRTIRQLIMINWDLVRLSQAVKDSKLDDTFMKFVESINSRAKMQVQRLQQYVR